MEPPTHPNNWNAGLPSRNKPSKAFCISKSLGYLPMRPGLTRSKYGGVTSSVNFYSPIILSQLRISKPLFLNILPITTRRPKRSNGPILLNNWNTNLSLNSEGTYDSLYLVSQRRGQTRKPSPLLPKLHWLPFKTTGSSAVIGVQHPFAKEHIKFGKSQARLTICLTCHRCFLSLPLACGTIAASRTRNVSRQSWKHHLSDR